ncbi:protein EVI2B [Mus pahari]|uniref:protein EVI2B n=1 Tax=Mus pahari TaxID=10093 RepID=UPI000A30BCD2|nr:protein EVI2B [Mus pahari]
MEFKYLVFILLCQYLNNTFFSETEAITTEQQSLSTLITSSLYATTDSQNTTRFNNISSGRQVPPAQITPEQTTPAVYVSSKPLTYNITRRAESAANSSFPQTSLAGFTLTNQLSPSAYNSTRQPPKHLVYTSTQQPPSPAPTSSGKPVLESTHNQPTKSTPTIYLPRDTPPPPPPLTSEPPSGKGTAHRNNHNAIAAILIGTIIISMLVAILMIILWKYLRKPVLNDQNWAGRSPFADGETPEMCMDNIRESEVSTKRASVVSLMTWKPSKSTLPADGLEVKLFESSEHINDTHNLKTENVEVQINGLSEDSADGSTVGTAVSSDDADLALPPLLLDLDENLPNKPTMIVVSPLPNDSINLQPSPDGLNQVCEEHHSKIQEPFPPPPDSFNVPLSTGDFINNQESTHEAQCQESSPPDLDPDLTASLPPPPTELL